MPRWPAFVGRCFLSWRLQPKGFTLIELVMVLVLLAVVAAVGLPKMLGLGGLPARGFHDQTLTLLRYAHKAAVAQRRMVCATFTSSSLSLTIDADENASTGGNGCEGALAGPPGATNGFINAASGQQYQNFPGVIVFDPLGRPDAGQTVRVAGVGAPIIVEPATGFVRD